MSVGTLAPADPRFLAEVRSILTRAEQRGIPLRACGSVGVYLAVEADAEAVAIYRRRGLSPPHGRLFKDLDLVGLEKQSSGLFRLFVRELGFTEDRETNALFGMYRNIFFHPEFHIDVFFDRLRFSHELPLRDRLTPGLSLQPEDLLLAKLQIHDITRKDLVDLAALILVHPLGRLDRGYLSRILGDDWGFWFDAQNNLGAADAEVAQWASTPDPTGVRRSRERLTEMRRFLTDMPKTRRWEKRAAKGTREPWFEPVDELR